MGTPDYIPPKQDPNLRTDEPPPAKYYNPAPRSSGGGAQIGLGILMLVGGIALSAAGTGRVFVGLIAVGAITLIKGIASAGK